MPVTFDSTSRSTGATITSLTWTHTNQGDALTVSVIFNETLATSTTVTFAGASATRVGGPLVSGSRLELWTLMNPSTGASTVTVTVSSATEISAAGVSYAGTSTTSGFLSTTGISSGPALTIASAENDRVIDVVLGPTVGPTGSTVGPGQTHRIEMEADQGGVHGRSDEAGAASVAMTWSLSSTDWGLVGLNLVSSQAVVTRRPRMLQHLGM